MPLHIWKASICNGPCSHIFHSLLARWQHYYSSRLLTEFLWWPCTSSSDGVLTREVLATAPFSMGSLLKQLGLDLSQFIHNTHKGLVKTTFGKVKNRMHANVCVNQHPLHMTKFRQCSSKNKESPSCILCSYVHRWYSNTPTSLYRRDTNNRKVSDQFRQCRSSKNLSNLVNKSLCKSYN